jgi:hypothetical protein
LGVVAAVLVVGTLALIVSAGGGDSSRRPPRTRADHRPFDGDLLIADRGNDRLLLVNARKQILWRYPAPGRPAPRGGFYFPDDAFFTRRGTGIISNQEGNDTIVQIAFPRARSSSGTGIHASPDRRTATSTSPTMPIC